MLNLFLPHLNLTLGHVHTGTCYKLAQLVGNLGIHPPASHLATAPVDDKSIVAPRTMGFMEMRGVFLFSLVRYIQISGRILCRIRFVMA